MNLLNVNLQHRDRHGRPLRLSALLDNVKQSLQCTGVNTLCLRLASTHRVGFTTARLTIGKDADIKAIHHAVNEWGCVFEDFLLRCLRRVNLTKLKQLGPSCGIDKFQLIGRWVGDDVLVASLRLLR